MFTFYWRNVAQCTTLTSVCLVLRRDSAKRRRQRSPKFVFFHGLTAQKPYVPHQNWPTKGISLGYRLVSEMIPIARNCALWAVPLSQTPPRKCPFSVVFGPVKPLRRNSKFSTVYACARRFMSFISKSSKSVQDKWPQVRVVLVTEKNTFWHR